MRPDLQAPPRSLRLGVFAEAFGFGPASKAAAIVTELRGVADVSVVSMTSSIAHEFLAREGFGVHPPTDLQTEEGQRQAYEVAPDIDVALVVMQPEAACVLADSVPVVYVDSLGFMWEREFFDRYEALRRTAAYVVQDAFWSAKRVEAFGVQNVMAVGGLTAPAPVSGFPADGPIAHAGGLVNIFSESDGPSYLSFIDRLVMGVLPTGTEVLASEAVRKRAPSLQVLQLATLSHADVQQRFANAEAVFTSPGMTALLELSSMNRPTVPLPPQNLSQALIVRHVAEAGSVPEVWQFLAESYPIETGLPESEGVARVRSLNEDFSQSAEFRHAYRDLASRAYHDRSQPPSSIVPSFDGLQQTAAIVLDVHQRRGAKRS